MISPDKVDMQIKDMSNKHLLDITNSIHKQGVAVFYNQKMNEADYIKTMKKFGECEAPDLFMNPKEHPEIFLVTGKKVNGKKLGMFGDTELGWHSNGNSRHLIDKILIGLYCVKEDINTTLSVCNTQQPFSDLPTEFDRDYYRDITIRLKFKNNTIYDLEEGDPELEFMSKNKGSIRKLVGKHPHTGQEYFYFPYHFITKAWKGKKQIDHEEMINKLMPLIFKSQYQYHHIFKEGDLLLMDQFTSLHRRTPVMDNNRLLWRIASDFKTIHSVA